MAQKNFVQNVILVLALAATIALFFIDIYYGVMALFFLVVLLMSFRIMGETTHYTDIVASLPDNARGIVLLNRGNDIAQDIHVTLIPQNLEFDLHKLDADATHTFVLPMMIEKVKVLVIYKNRDGVQVSRSFLLSSVETEPKQEEDLLKPAFPLFGWK